MHGDLTLEQRELFLEVVDASLRITRRHHFFSWLQGAFQSLLPHDVLLCGYADSGGDGYRFECFSSTIDFTEAHLDAATAADDSLLWRAMQAWGHLRRPLYVKGGQEAGNYGAYVVPFADEEGVLAAMNLRNIAAHGVCGVGPLISSWFCLARMPGPPDAAMLELLVPYMHAALVRISADLSAGQVAAANQEDPVSKREKEILKWLHRGKTNWEIAQILEISPFTVKNHVHNILLKLNVHNRNLAWTRAVKLGLIEK